MAYYEPGKEFIPTGSPNWLNTKRVLSSDEYEYYHHLLKDGNYSDVIKAGMAVVLLADLKRWANVHTILVEDYLSPTVEKYVAIFSNLPDNSDEKFAARKEITNFDKFLVYTQAQNRGQLHLDIEQARQSFAVRLATAKRDALKLETIEEILAKETEEIQLKEEVEETRKQTLIIADALDAHMISRIREYLAGVYETSVGKLFMDDENAQREFKTRTELIKRVQNKSLHPMEAIAQYQKILDEFAGNLSNPNKPTIIGGLYDHPMMREVR